MKISEEIKKNRETRNISQKELANKTGITQQAISLWENGFRSPNIEQCIKLADYYCISIDDLVGHEIKKNW